MTIRFHALIDGFGRRTGVPVVLNTSFNNHAEPIVDSVDDAITAFLTTGIDELLMDDWLIRKSPGELRSRRTLELHLTLPPTQKLVRRTDRAGGELLAIESTASRFSAQPAVAVSREMFSVLARPSGSSLEARCRDLGIVQPTALGALASECFELWCSRAISLAPANATAG